MAHTGSDGLEKALHGNVHAVILDVMLPGLDGFAVLKQIRAQATTNDRVILFALEYRKRLTIPTPPA